MKGLQKVNGEMNLIMLVYNIKRTFSIVGFTKMLEAIQNWQPDYTRIVCALKNAIIKLIYGPDRPFNFLKQNRLIFLKAAM